MAQRDLRVSGRPTRLYTVPDFIREELREQPLSKRQVLGFLVGLAAVLLFVAFFLATGRYPA